MFLAGKHLVFFCLAVLLLCRPCAAAAQTVNMQQDSDGDGLSDEFEQALLEKFRPTFMISATDCATRPARFSGGLRDPELLATDGTIYGQAFRVSNGAVEIHYYTLWERDCGQVSHPLDVEHVAALISTDGPEPRALYWYAGAHEKTVCDISSGARAQAVAAEQHGPTVWSSSGKHALYFMKAMCKSGCGADSCDDDIELARNGAIINLGELNAAANGSSWVASPKWVIADKMDSDFSVEVIARLKATSGDRVVTLRGRSTVRGTIQGSDTVIDTATLGARHTEAALDTAESQTSSGLQKATRATGRSLSRAWRAVFGRKQTKLER